MREKVRTIGIFLATACAVFAVLWFVVIPMVDRTMLVRRTCLVEGADGEAYYLDNCMCLPARELVRGPVRGGHGAGVP